MCDDGPVMDTDTLSDPLTLYHASPEPLICGIPLARWLNAVALPIHIYSEQRIRANIAAFRSVLQNNYPKARIHYAAKAQPAMPILEIMASEGLGADVASLNELQAALDAGIDPRGIGINGNAKEDDLLETAIARDLLLIVDNEEELSLINQMGLTQNRRVSVLLRVSGFALGQTAEKHVRTGGNWSKFGMPVSEIPACIAQIREYPALNLVGFHMHLGSQVIDAAPYRLALGQLIECSKRVIGLGGHIKIINLGGGFPVSYLAADAWAALRTKVIRGYEALRRGDTQQTQVFLEDTIGQDALEIERSQTQWLRNRAAPSLPKEQTLEALLKGDLRVEAQSILTRQALESIGEPLLQIEPGRSLIEDAGLTLARVANVKRIAGAHALVNLEMGIGSHIDSLIERSIRRWSIVNEPQRRDPVPFEAFVAGNLCFNGDILSRIKIPFHRRPVRGDIVAAFDTGAYCSHFLASASNGFARPAQVLVQRSGAVTILREREPDAAIIRPKASGSRLF